MHRARRSTEVPRLDLMPLIDVVFLLLTFFVFAMVLMVQLNTEGIRLPKARSGEAVSDVAVTTIALNAEGEVLIDGVTIPKADLQAKLTEWGDEQIFIAPDVRAPVGSLFELIGLLKEGGVENIKFIRQTDNSPVPG